MYLIEKCRNSLLSTENRKFFLLIYLPALDSFTYLLSKYLLNIPSCQIEFHALGVQQNKVVPDLTELAF